MTFTGDVNIQTSPGLTYNEYAPGNAGAPLDIQPLPGTAAITSLNGVSGPTVAIDGTGIGFQFSAAGASISMTVSNAATVRTAIGAAARGANGDITSLTALTLAIISTLRWRGYISAANDPTTTELPTDKDVAIYKNTLSGNIFLAFNNAATIVKVQLT
jgi:hypothetical protein